MDCTASSQIQVQHGFLTRNASRRFWPALIIAVTVFLHLAGPLRIGFISDDFDLIHGAASASWFRAQEKHHFSPVLTGLFKLTAVGLMTAQHWHVLMLIIHLLNCILLYRLLLLHFGMKSEAAGSSVLLFAAGPAGFEAQAWACTLGYLVLATMVFLALQLGFRIASNPHDAHPYLLAIVQLGALAFWDWGILVLPLVALLFVSIRLSRSEPRIKDILFFLLPGAITLVLVTIIRAFFEVAYGYEKSFEPILSAAHLVVSPLRAIAPNLPIEYYSSFPGALISLGIWGILLRQVRSSHPIRFLTSAFIATQLPYLFFGAPQSRYFYLAAAFIYPAIILSCFSLPSTGGYITERRKSKGDHELKVAEEGSGSDGSVRSADCRPDVPPRFLGLRAIFNNRSGFRPQICIRRLALYAFVLMTGWWAYQRAELWRQAYVEARKVKSVIEALPSFPHEELVVINLPDCYGAPNIMWRPYMWRNGLSNIKRAITRVITPDCLFVWGGGPIPLIERSQISKVHPNACYYEFVEQNYRGHREFSLSRVE